MRRGFRPPMFAIAAALLGLIALLATLQYQWLAQISESEREQMSANLRLRAHGFADDFDRELNLAYVLFQIGPMEEGESLAAQLAARHERWEVHARRPRLIKEIYVATPGASGLQRYNVSTRFVEPAEWPASLERVRARIAERADTPPPAQGASVFVRPLVATVWPDVPAMVAPAPMLFVNQAAAGRGDMRRLPQLTYTILLLDADYIRNDLLPAIAHQHFQQGSDGVDYQLAVVPAEGGDPVYRSVSGFTPGPDAKADAAVDLFRLRTQDFGPLVAEVSRFTMYTSVRGRGERSSAHTQTLIRQGLSGQGTVTLHDGAPVSIIVQDGTKATGAAGSADSLIASATANVRAKAAAAPAPRWRLVVKHPSGSLEQFVDSARRRNLLISTTILGVLGLSVGFLVVSTRRAHDLARQQLEFVATVSHELRTPLAVIRSAADNLADGVVGDETRVRQYGELVRREGVRLTDLVEQILEYAGLQAGQRTVSRVPVTIDSLLRECAAAITPIADAAGVAIELTIPGTLPPVAGEEAALRRVFQNLLGNAVKYGSGAGWVGVRAAVRAGAVEVDVADRGIGIAPAEQAKIFDPFYRTPDVVAAQIQGAGLGLSLVKRIVEAHGGRISVTSAPGQGSTFTVSLPVATGDPAGAERGVAEAATQTS